MTNWPHVASTGAQELPATPCRGGRQGVTCLNSFYKHDTVSYGAGAAGRNRFLVFNLPKPNSRSSCWRYPRTQAETSSPFEALENTPEEKARRRQMLEATVRTRSLAAIKSQAGVKPRACGCA